MIEETQKFGVFGFSEVVDTACDIIESGVIVSDALTDGVQISDLAALFQLAPKAKEIKGDWRTALDQLNDLDPAEAKEAARQIAARTGNPVDGILARVNEAFDIVADAYGLIKQGTYLVDRVIRWAKSLRKTSEVAAG